MAEIALKSIKFPGLANTYTIPQIDTTLTQSGRYADSKVVGDKIEGVKGDLSAITGNTAISTWTAGSIATSGATVDITDIKNLTSYRHVTLSVSPGDTFTINAQGGGSPRAWAFTDSSYNVLSNSAASVTLMDTVITAPESAAYLIINDNNSGGVCFYSASVPQRFVETYRAIAENAEDINKINAELATETGLQVIDFAADNRYIRVNYSIGTTVSLTPQSGSSAMGYKYSLIDVSPGDVFTISASNVNGNATNAEARPIAVLNSSNELLYVAPSGTLDKTEYTIPANGAKLIINTCNGETSYKGKSRIVTAESDISNMVAMAVAEDANIGGMEYFINAELKDLLTVEKMSCIHHDNFHRADNSADIGYNGTSTVPMSYSRINTSGGENLAVGIYNNKAAFTNPSSLAASTVVLETVDVGQYPYKVSVSTDEFGVVVVGVLGSTSYVRIDVKPNNISISPSNTFQIAESKSFAHGMGKGIADIYVYKDKIVCKVFGITVISVPAKMTSTVCGMLFRAGNANTSYNMFNVFVPDKFENNAIDYIVERSDYSLTYDSNSGNYSNPLLGIVQKSTEYGMMNDISITNMSRKSLRFELRQTDPVSNASKRAELVPKDPKPAFHALQTKIFDFDVFFPLDYADESVSEIFLQMHDRPDGVNADGLNPGIEFETKSGEMRMVIKGSSDKMTANNAEDHVYTLGTIKKGEWTHFTVFMREGYMAEHFPVVAVWVDKELKAISYDLNAYNELYGSYLKFGMYKPAWKTAPTTVDTRVIYFDNFVVWQ